MTVPRCVKIQTSSGLLWVASAPRKAPTRIIAVDDRRHGQPHASCCSRVPTPSLPVSEAPQDGLPKPMGTGRALARPGASRPPPVGCSPAGINTGRGLGAIRGLHGWGWGCGNPSPYGWDLPPPARGTCPKGTSAAHRTPANPAAPTPVRNPSEGEFFPSQNRMLSRVNRD